MYQPTQTPRIRSLNVSKALPPALDQLAARAGDFLRAMAACFAEQWADTAELDVSDLGLERASSEEEVLAKILKLQVSMATALKVGSEAAKRDWCKICTLDCRLQETSGSELLATDDEFVEAMCEKRERLVKINGRSITETTFEFREGM